MAYAVCITCSAAAWFEAPGVAKLVLLHLQAEEEERQRVEAERLAQQLRGRFLLRLWRGAARRQREERALLRLAACSVAGSLPRSPAAALALPDSTPPTQLKVLMLSTVLMPALEPAAHLFVAGPS